ncbi:hypothetical protein KEM52_002910 [Ascosphaera acerosa]|nr:hypothetical protein KEM52_002910 [Ascosphaera acerosa]
MIWIGKRKRRCMTKVEGACGGDGGDADDAAWRAKPPVADDGEGSWRTSGFDEDADAIEKQQSQLLTLKLKPQPQPQSQSQPQPQSQPQWQQQAHHSHDRSPEHAQGLASSAHGDYSTTSAPRLVDVSAGDARAVWMPPHHPSQPQPQPHAKPVVAAVLAIPARTLPRAVLSRKSDRSLYQSPIPSAARSLQNLSSLLAQPAPSVQDIDDGGPDECCSVVGEGTCQSEQWQQQRAMSSSHIRDIPRDGGDDQGPATATADRPPSYRQAIGMARPLDDEPGSTRQPQLRDIANVAQPHHLR